MERFLGVRQLIWGKNYNATKQFVASKLQNVLSTSVNLTISNYCSLRKGNKNASASALKCLLKKMKFNFNLLPASFKCIYCLVGAL
jgi:hypothetical protein